MKKTFDWETVYYLIDSLLRDSSTDEQRNQFINKFQPICSHNIATYSICLISRIHFLDIHRHITQSSLVSSHCDLLSLLPTIAGEWGKGKWSHKSWSKMVNIFLCINSFAFSWADAVISSVGQDVVPILVFISLGVWEGLCILQTTSWDAYPVPSRQLPLRGRKRVCGIRFVTGSI